MDFEQQASRSRAVVSALTALIAIGAVACGFNDGDTTSSATATNTLPGAAGPTATTAQTTSTTATPTGITATTASSVTVSVIDTPYGEALGNGQGLVFYAWENDRPGESTCVAVACVEKWPPVVVESLAAVTFDGVDTSAFSTITRPDGSLQLTVGERPLYRMAIDEPGEANCQGADGWWILNADGSWNKNTDGAK